MFVHMVFFWLKSDAPPTAPSAMAADCRDLLGRIPGVRHVWAGGPAGTPRDIVDNSYAVGLTVILDDVKGHDVYQEHALHKEFISRHKPHWQRVQVYDFVDDRTR
jgi:hypothetical protein